MLCGCSPSPPGLRLITTYKFTKAVLQVAAAVLLFYGAAHGLTARLAEFAEKLREHAVHAWSNVFAAALLRFTHSRHSLTLHGVRAARRRRVEQRRGLGAVARLHLGRVAGGRDDGRL